MSSTYFCYTMLCCYAEAWPMQSCSVRLSVTFMYFVETNKHIFQIFSSSGSHTTLLLPHQTVWQYSDGNPLTGAKIAILNQYLAFCVSSTLRWWSIGYSTNRRPSLAAAPRISESCLWQKVLTLDVTPKTTEKKLIVRIGKSKTQVTIIEDCAQGTSSTVLLELTTVNYTDRHEASRGLSATAELLVITVMFLIVHMPSLLDGRYCDFCISRCSRQSFDITIRTDLFRQ